MVVICNLEKNVLLGLLGSCLKSVVLYEQKRQQFNDFPKILFGNMTAFGDSRTKIYGLEFLSPPR